MGVSRVRGTEHLLGSFWLAGSRDQALTGWLDLSGKRPTVTLNGQLTPAMARNVGGTGVEYGEPVDDTFNDEKLTLHGYLAEGARRKVTILDAITISRRYNLFAVGDSSEGVHVLRGTWAVRGAHIEPNEEVVSSWFKFTNLDEWIGTNGITATVTLRPRKSVEIRYEEPSPVSASIPSSGEGTVSTQFLSVPDPDVFFNGAEIRHRSWIYLRNVHCSSFSVLLQEMVYPVVTLASVMMRRKCFLTEISILTNKDEYSLDVYHPILEPEAADDEYTPGRRTLGLRDVGITVLAGWISRSAKFNPIPNIVYSSYNDNATRTLESRLLELAAAAEGFDRRKYGDEAIFERSVARKARRAAIGAARDVAGEDVANRVSQTMSFFNSPTYAERLRRLLTFTDSALPGVAGNWKEWIKRVKEARNGYAHQLDRPGDSWELELILLESLQWVLSAAVLLEAGVESEIIEKHLSDDEEYRFFRRKAKALAPAVYESEEY
ncbi:MAG TPA: HEPN domain-containing protein [Amycolatopsis sp.]|nr:HEPN domain-containing protein [Amycolatopsis sp.]